MRSHHFVVAAAALLSTFTSVSSAVLLYEPFDYPAGTNINGIGPNASQSWALAGPDTGTPIATTSSGLSVPGLDPGGAGNAVQYVHTGDTLRINIQDDGTAISTGSVFFSLMLQVNDLASTPTNNGTGSFIGGLNNLSGTQTNVPSTVGAKIRMEQVTGDGTDYVLGTQSNGGASAFDTTQVFHPGDKIFAVYEYNIDTMISQLWINPSTSDYGAASAPAASVTSGAGNAIALGIASFVLRGNSVAPDTTVDELRVGTTWADVTSIASSVHNAGDTNNDRVVDLTDLNNVLNNFGSTGAGNPGDDDSSGVVDLTDLNNVLNNFGTTYGAAALNVVPEPASLSLLGLGAAALLARRRRTSSSL